VELQTIMSYIVGENEAEYVLNIWEPMLSKWQLEEEKSEWEGFLSKMMEMERACVEEGDQRPIVTINKSLNECRVKITKRNNEIWTYILLPYGFQKNWEIFKVDRKKL